MQPPITDLSGHPCITDTRPNSDSKYRCLRCYTATAWDTQPCAPGMTVHLPPYPEDELEQQHHNEARRHWLSAGFNVVVGATDHRYFTTCMQCYDTELDPKLRQISTPAQMPHAGFERLTPTTTSGTPVFHDGYVARVLWAIDWPPETHTGYAPANPAAHWVRQVVTTHGSAWYSHPEGGHYRVQRNDDTTEVSFAHNETEPRYRLDLGKTTALYQLPAPPPGVLIIDLDPPASQ